MLDCIHFERHEWLSDKQKILDKVEKTFRFPVFVKPANLGSSIGISKAQDVEGLKTAIDIAIHYDRRILVEPAVTDLKEINCSVAGFGKDLKVSVLEEPVLWKEFLTFEDKYLRGNMKGMKSLQRRIPAEVDPELQTQVEELSLDIFKVMDLKGVVRIDYLLDNVKNKVYVNEVNTIPGSFAFYLWEPKGVSFMRLLDDLIDYAFEQVKEKHANSFAYDSEILNKVRIGGKLSK